MPIRWAAWVAVSTKGQAKGYNSDVDELDDKDSLDAQLEKCRALGASRGWLESAGPFVVPGESRTRWANLRDAEDELPALKQMLNMAQAGAYDVLVMYDYTRLRRLLDPVAYTLSQYRVQLYSLGQPSEIVPPEEYDPTDSDTASTIQFVSGFTSKAEIAAFRRRYQLGMPRRIQKGLPKGWLPFGYRKPPGHEHDSKAVPIQDPTRARVVIEMKDKFLSGQSLWQIANRLQEQGYPTPRRGKRWTDEMVSRILHNRFYSGEISFGKKARKLDPRTGKVRIVKNPPGRVIIARGLHPPLWDEKIQRAIDAEFKRRGQKYTGIRTQRLSSLMRCSVCGATLWIKYHGLLSDEHRRWACSADSHHLNILDQLLTPRVMAAFADALCDVENIKTSAPADRRAILEASIKDLSARRTRLLDAYEAGSLALSDYAARVPDLDTQIAAAKAELENEQGMISRRAERIEMIGGMAGLLDKLPGYLMDGPVQEVNSHLRAVLEKIVITPDGGVRIMFLS